MCLYVKKAKRPRRIRKVWKVLRVSVGSTGVKLSGGEITSAVLRSPYFGRVYKIGENKATGRISVRRRAIGRIHGGAFHAYHDVKKARGQFLGTCEVLVPLYGKPQHYVAHGTRGQICYTHLTLKPEDYQKAVKEAARKRKAYEREQATKNSCS